MKKFSDTSGKLSDLEIDPMDGITVVWFFSLVCDVASFHAKI